LVHSSEGSSVNLPIIVVNNRLCGHATLASAYILQNHPEILSEPLTGNIVFHTKWSGQLIVDISSSDGLISMDFPADSFPETQTTVNKDEVAPAIGLSSENIIEIKASRECKYAVIEVEQSVDIQLLRVEPFTLVIEFFGYAVDDRVDCSQRISLNRSQIFLKTALWSVAFLLLVLESLKIRSLVQCIPSLDHTGKTKQAALLSKLGNVRQGEGTFP
jgi:hypothetical protein